MYVIAGGVRLQKLVDVTIAYPQGNPLDLIQIASAWRRPCITHVHYRIFDVNDVSSLKSDYRAFKA